MLVVPFTFLKLYRMELKSFWSCLAFHAKSKILLLTANPGRLNWALLPLILFCYGLLWLLCSAHMKSIYFSFVILWLNSGTPVNFVRPAINLFCVKSRKDEGADNVSKTSSCCWNIWQWEKRGGCYWRFNKSIEEHRILVPLKDCCLLLKFQNVALKKPKPFIL